METNQIAFILIVAIVIGFGVIEYFVRAQKVTEEDSNESNQKNSGVSRDAISSSTDQKLDEAVSSDNFQPILHKLDEIHSTMKAIRWTIAGGFLFIMLVVTGIIKPGTFG